MALDQSALLELLDAMRSADGSELMRRLLAAMLQLLVDAEATAFIGAEPYQRGAGRTNRRNGTRDKLVATAIWAPFSTGSTAQANCPFNSRAVLCDS